MEDQSYVGEKENNTLIVEVYPGEGVWDHYLDNGEDFEYREGKFHQYRFSVSGDEVKMDIVHAGYEKPYKEILLKYPDGTDNSGPRSLRERQRKGYRSRKSPLDFQSESPCLHP